MNRFASVSCALAIGFSACLSPDAGSKKLTLQVPLDADIKGFDPIHSTDAYSHTAITQVYQTLLQYKYLVRPYQLEPLLAAEPPTVSKDGLTYTFRLREKVFFHDDPAFGGKPRALKASDFVYSFKRLADPHQKSPDYWLLEGKIEGLDEFREKLKSAPPPIRYADFNVSGLTAPDHQTLILKLMRPDRQLLYALAMVATSVVAEEIVAKYGAEFLNHPIGTGPFVLQEWRRGQKIRFRRNPDYWREAFPTEGNTEDAGRPMPFVDELTLWIYVEQQPRWLNFLKGNLDMTAIPKEGFDSVFDERGEMREDIRRRKIISEPAESLDLVMFAFNMDDPLLGRNRELRQAISSAINRTELIRLFYNNRAIQAEGPIPPGVFGYDPNLKNPYRSDLALAKQLIKKALVTYRAGGGKGEIPPISFDSISSTVNRQLAEAIARDLANIGLRLTPRFSTWPQFQEKMAKRQSQLFGYGWNADYPDPDNFLQLLYSKNAAPGPNNANFRNANYDRLYQKMRDLPDGAERQEVIGKMVRIVQEETPWVLFAHRIAYPTRHAWVRNFKRNALVPGLFKYIAIDPKAKAETLPLLK